MTGMILAAGLGTRLRPWTLEHPKALVPVNGVPMLERVINLMSDQGFETIIINVHHFSGQIVEFIKTHDFGVNIIISDESDMLLDTGGGILRASSHVHDQALLVHNVDILSTADLHQLYKKHLDEANDITLLVCDRNSSRKLIFDKSGDLCGWHNLITDDFRKITDVLPEKNLELAFSGIYVMGSYALQQLEEYSQFTGRISFPIMDFLLSGFGSLRIRALRDDSLEILDIGKPSAIEQAESFISKNLLQ